MNEMEIGELRRRQRRDRSNITAIYGCYVNDNKEIITQFRQSTGIMPENESDKYFALLRRVFSGGIGKNLIDITIVFYVFMSRKWITLFMRSNPKFRILPSVSAAQIRNHLLLYSFNRYGWRLTTSSFSGSENL